jgi:hypothetical protein
MTKIHCDLCDKVIEPRTDAYKWFSKGGLIAIVEGRPARLVKDGKVLNEVCFECSRGCHAMVYWSEKGLAH